MYKIAVFVPENCKEHVKKAMFEAGAGKIGNYEYCAWEIEGQGQFRPLKGSQPYLGAQDSLEYVQEFKIEMVCDKSFVKAVLAAMKQAHPYETPAYDVIELLEL